MDPLCPELDEPIAAFLLRARPTQVSTHAWVQVHAPGRIAADEAERRRGDEAAALAFGQQVLADATPANVAVTVDQLLEVARRTGCATGKWLVFADAATVDQVWGRIATAVVAGHLDYSAQVSTQMQQQANPGNYVICVYVAACHDHGAVTRVACALTVGLRLELRAGFKPDIFTALGIYNNNKWGIPPTIFQDVRDNAMSQATTAAAIASLPEGTAVAGGLDAVGGGGSGFCGGVSARRSPNVWYDQGQDAATLHLEVGGSQATWGEVIQQLGTVAGCTHWNAVLDSCPYDMFFLELPPLCSSTRQLPFEMCAVRAAPAQVARWNSRLDRETFPAVRFGRGSHAPVTFWSLGRRTWLVSPGDPGGEVGENSVGQGIHSDPIAACRCLASFVREARPEQQQKLWHRMGLELQARSVEDRPTWVSTDGTGVHWLHLRLSYRPDHYKYEPYTHDPNVGGRGQHIVTAASVAGVGEDEERLRCRECNRIFVFSASERATFAKRGYQPPKTCEPCRDRRRAR
eukprot:SAG31_NODE_1449_length_8308_cov_2.319893_4_plen_518_part_00